MAASKKILPHAHLLVDASRTSLLALKESADAFPPLKAAVGGVLARAKHARSHACDVAHRTQDILHVIADAVPDPRTIPPPMLKSIQRFTELLEDIRQEMEELTRTGFVSRVFHLNRNEHKLQDIRERLDNAYRDFVAASALRLEAQHSETRIEMQKMTIANNTDLSKLLFSARFQNVCSFFGRPLAREAPDQPLAASLLSPAAAVPRHVTTALSARNCLPFASPRLPALTVAPPVARFAATHVPRAPRLPTYATPATWHAPLPMPRHPACPCVARARHFPATSPTRPRPFLNVRSPCPPPASRTSHLRAPACAPTSPAAHALSQRPLPCTPGPPAPPPFSPRATHARPTPLLPLRTRHVTSPSPLPPRCARLPRYPSRSVPHPSRHAGPAPRPHHRAPHTGSAPSVRTRRRVDTPIQRCDYIGAASCPAAAPASTAAPVPFPLNVAVPAPTRIRFAPPPLSHAPVRHAPLAPSSCTPLRITSLRRPLIRAIVRDHVTATVAHRFPTATAPATTSPPCAPRATFASSLVLHFCSPRRRFLPSHLQTRARSHHGPALIHRTLPLSGHGHRPTPSPVPSSPCAVPPPHAASPPSASTYPSIPAMCRRPTSVSASFPSSPPPFPLIYLFPNPFASLSRASTSPAPPPHKLLRHRYFVSRGASPLHYPFCSFSLIVPPLHISLSASLP
ncbi:hypothetical protein B0H14DRAFT_3746040 [Mycena olivaceomarginata]|nr:hypothetical protein B0H14DRAFT_3746040 [Mycena olivaceomarginata]